MADTETLSVPEIHCGHCKSSIEGALQHTEGVLSAVVDVPGRTVTIEYDSSKVVRPDLIAVIEEQGYAVPAQ